ncbi:MAG TPA: hypothetical protein VMM85_05400 [Methylomirabilota bacterium]|nr:hypothetical protein [Methylomirabilota bacterium]
MMLPVDPAHIEGSDDGEVHTMAKGRDRPKRQAKRKPKEKAPKVQPTSGYEPPTRQVEIIKPERKPRSPEPDEE